VNRQDGTVNSPDERTFRRLFRVVGSLPWLVFGLVAGGIVDRVDLHRLLVRVDLVRAFVTGALVLAVATGRASMWILLVLTLLLGIGETLFDTAAPRP
jgi:hypothetical protein